MQHKRIKAVVACVLSVVLAVLMIPVIRANAAYTMYNNQTISQDGYDYTLWKDYGDTSMTVNSNGAFSCSWGNIGNALFRAGKSFDCTRTHSQIGNISINFGCNYQPNGNSYLCVYGWSRNPLVEYYIVESWGSWRPPGANSKGTIYVDGGAYDVYETTRYNQPSIDGNTTFKQYWSVRQNKRTSGTISVSEHFNKWAQMGMNLGGLYEVALNVEGYQSGGYADVYQNQLVIGSGYSNNNNNNNNNSWNNNNNNNNNNGNNNNSGEWQGLTVQCEDMTKGGQYTGNINNPFNGVALYANNDSVSYTQNFGYYKQDFSLRACSNNSNMARVDLYIGGQYKGTFYYGGSYPATYTIHDVEHGTGNQEVKLVVTADDGNWDVYMDSLFIK